MTKVKIYGAQPQYKKPPKWWPFHNRIIGRLLWKVIGNSDDPEPPSWFKPNDKHRILKWYIRNPFHNFTFYIIGLEDKDRICYGINAGKVLTDGFCVYLSKIKGLPIIVPFLSYQRTMKNRIFQFYIGWRRGGAFGIKCRIILKK